MVIKIVGAVFVLLFLGYFSLGLYLSTPPYKGEISDHFDGKRFYNLERFEKSERSFWRWMLTRKRAPWPDWVDIKQGPKPVSKFGDGLKVTFINQATMLIQTHWLNILTDPMYSDRCFPFQSWGPKRVHDPGIKYEDLPKIDVVLISHNHYDHLDVTTLKRLQKSFKPVFYVGLGGKAYLEKLGLTNIKELDWWDEEAINHEVSTTFVPAQHFNRRGFFDYNTSLWGGFVIETPSGSLYFAGDTGYGGHFKTIAKRKGPFKLALIPIGAYEPRWFMKKGHVNPEEAVQAHIDLKAEKSIGIHFGTFQLTDEPREEPVEHLKLARKKLGVSDDDFIVLGPGGSLKLSP